MSIRVCRVLAAVSLIAVFHATEAAARDVELRNWSTPMYWGPAVTPRAADSGAARHGLSGEAPPTANNLISAPTSPLFFVAVPPCRLADTRSGYGFSGAWGPPALVSSTPRDFPITGQCGVPTSAQAVSFNFTVVGPAATGFLTAYPAGGTLPNVSTLNFVSGQTVANAAIVPLGAGGAITTVTGLSGADVVIDVNGYYALSGDRNPAPSSPGNDFTIQGGGASVGGDGHEGRRRSRSRVASERPRRRRRTSTSRPPARTISRARRTTSSWTGGSSSRRARR